MADYDYIKRQYGIDYRPGQRVVLEGKDKRAGTVARSRTQLHYVKVAFDDGATGYAHPNSLTFEGPDG